MRFHAVSAALVAATALFSGAVADDSHVATTTLTRTLQRVVETVTQTRPSSGLITGTAGPNLINGTVYASPTVSAPTSSRTGAAVTMRIDTAGLAAVAGIVGYLAL